MNFDFDRLREEQEAAALLGFRVVMTGTIGLFECVTCSALCRRDGMSSHDSWHEELRREVHGSDS
jgi:hypothetical protein